MGGVGLLRGDVVVVEGCGCLAHVAVGGAEHVVGTEAEEGGVPPVVIMSDNGPDGVGTEGLVRAAHLLEVLQLSEPVAATSPTGGEEAEQEG